MTAMPFTCFAEESSDNIIILNDDVTFNTDTNTMYFKSNPEDRSFQPYGFDDDVRSDPQKMAFYKQREELLQKTRKVVLEYGVKYICSEFFHDLPNLEEVEMPYTLEWIGAFAFWNCPKLKTVNGENVRTIDSGAFGRCTSLEFADFPNLTTFSYSKLDLSYYDDGSYWLYPVHEYYVGAFQECTALDNIYIPKVCKIGPKTFYKCSSLTTINENNTLKRVYGVGRSAFYGCKSLESISLPSARCLPSGRDPFSDSEFCEGVFGYCTSLTSINIPEVSNIGKGCFYGCSNLKTINSNNQLNSVETLGAYAFYGCKSLKTISLKKVKKLDYGKWNYYKAGAFKSVRDQGAFTEYFDVPTPDYAGTKYASVFGNCTNLKTVNISGAESIDKNTFMNCGKLQSVDITSAKNIGTKAFYNCTKLTTVKTGTNGKTINDYAFYNCSSLKTINIPKNVKTIGVRAFGRCSNLKTINMKTTAFDTIGLDAFKNIKSKATFNCPKSKLKTYKKLLKPNAPASSVFKAKY
jgi:hypothetical protein